MRNQDVAGIGLACRSFHHIRIFVIRLMRVGISSPVGNIQIRIRKITPIGCFGGTQRRIVSSQITCRIRENSGRSPIQHVQKRDIRGNMVQRKKTEIVDIGGDRQTALFLVVYALNPSCLFFRLVQRRKKHRRQNRDDRYHD